MGVLNKLFGYRWSLYVVQNGNQIAFAMHENSVFRMTGYVMSYFAHGAVPVAPWSLVLNFNKSHTTIVLGPEHFTNDGGNITRKLKEQVEAIDPGWDVRHQEPIFEQAVTKKRLPISSHKPGHIDIEAMMRSVGKPKEETFFTVMNTVFGK